MGWDILILIVGIIIGCTIGIKLIHTTPESVGTLKFLEDEENGNPYLFVDLDVNPNEFMRTQKYVIMKIDNQSMNSQK